MSTLDVAKVSDAPIDESQIRAQVEKICASAVFRRSGQSQKFLTYICDLTLRGRGSEINEYLIGLEVFHRGPNYSTAEDAIVRRQAHTLRSKLDSYYANEGELPIGHYEPLFRIHRPEPVAPPAEQPSSKYPLRLGDSRGIQRFIENLTPGPGEKPRYAKETPASAADPIIEYALVSMLPGTDGTHHTLLIAGLDGQATQMASEYLAQPARLDDLVGKLRKVDPSHKGAWYFQFVLRAEVRENLATRADIVAVRVLGA